MSSIAKSSISLSKKDLVKSRIPPVASRNIVFYHKTSGGELSINLLALSMPSEMPTNVQATAAEISGANLYTNKKNLSLQSSANGLLQQGLHYIVSSSTTIRLIGPYALAGAETDEIFTGVINSAPISDLVVASAKSINKTYELAIGATVLNVGREYQVGVNPNDNIGSIKVFVNGVLAHRDVEYAEVDSGSGYGTTIQFFVAPVFLPYQVAIDFGVMSITDNNAIGTIESLSGSMKKIADDLAVVAGTDADDYFSASPSEVERRTFGNTVLTLDSKYDTTQNLSVYTRTKMQTKTHGVVASGTVWQFNNLVIGKKYRISWDAWVSCGGGASYGLTLFNGATSLNNKSHETQGAAGVDKMPTNFCMPFVAVDTTLFVTATVVASAAVQSGVAVLEELPNHEITTDWT